MVLSVPSGAQQRGAPSFGGGGRLLSHPESSLWGAMGDSGPVQFLSSTPFSVLTDVEVCKDTIENVFGCECRNLCPIQSAPASRLN